MKNYYYDNEFDKAFDEAVEELDKEERILKVLKENYPKHMRLREIGAELGVWHCSLVGAMANLEGQGKVKVYEHRDFANMENYLTYKAV